ncbi:MAG: hypothetical protein PVF51_07080 [Nitrospirota bacterium]|jgi:hypothetical protein
MDTREQALLCALRSAFELHHAAVLEPERVNEVGAIQGLSPEDVCRLVDELRRQGLV